MDPLYLLQGYIIKCIVIQVYCLSLLNESSITVRQPSLFRMIVLALRFVFCSISMLSLVILGFVLNFCQSFVVSRTFQTLVKHMCDASFVYPLRTLC